MRRAHSAGGVVFRRPQPDAPVADIRILLLQHEAGKWMLPKGTIEAGETPEAVALREVAEETGLRNVRIVQDLGEEHTSELQSHSDLVCRLLLEKKKRTVVTTYIQKNMYRYCSRSWPWRQIRADER